MGCCSWSVGTGVIAAPRDEDLALAVGRVLVAFHQAEVRADQARTLKLASWQAEKK